MFDSSQSIFQDHWAQQEKVEITASDKPPSVNELGRIIDLPFVLRGTLVHGSVRSGVFNVAAPAEDLASKLFRNKAELKMLTAQIAMHLSVDERHGIFKALDRLLSIQYWDVQSYLLDPGAYRSFLRFIVHSKPKRLANLGVGTNGSLLAAWRRGPDRVVHAEFFPEDKCLSIVSAVFGRGPETIVREGDVARLREALRDIGVEDCLDDLSIESAIGQKEELPSS